MNHNIRKAVVMALAGSTVAFGGISSASASNTMYNTFNAFATATPTDGDPAAGGAQPTTDGWVWGGIGGTKAAPGPGTPATFVGIDGSKTPKSRTPFGYKGSAIVNWAVQLGCSDSGVISQADSFTRYGVYADIDTAKGAWSDNSVSGAGGWKHNLDIGLFKSKVDTDVTLSVAGLTQTGTQFGFTIFKGVDTTTDVAYGHHGAWNAGNNASGVTTASLVPGTSFTTADVVAYSVGGASPSKLNQIVFHAKANKVYTIVLGGYRNGAWYDTADGYVLTATTAAPKYGCSKPDKNDDKHDHDHHDDHDHDDGHGDH